MRFRFGFAPGALLTAILFACGGRTASSGDLGSSNDCLLCPTHACGDQTCQGTEMCITHPQSAGPALYECAPYPSACAREWTCLCVEYNLPAACKGPAQGCADDKLPVTLACAGP